MISFIGHTETLLAMGLMGTKPLNIVSVAVSAARNSFHTLHADLSMLAPEAKLRLWGPGSRKMKLQPSRTKWSRRVAHRAIKGPSLYTCMVKTGSSMTTIWATEYVNYSSQDGSGRYTLYHGEV